MLPKSQKIKKADFDSIIKQGRSYYSPYFSLRIAQKSSKTPSSFAFVVSKKVLPLAVDRNKLKRRGYAVVGGVISNIKPNFNIAFFAKKEAVGLKFGSFKEEVIFLLKKGDLLVS